MFWSGPSIPFRNFLTFQEQKSSSSYWTKLTSLAPHQFSVTYELTVNSAAIRPRIWIILFASWMQQNKQSFVINKWHNHNEFSNAIHFINTWIFHRIRILAHETIIYTEAFPRYWYVPFGNILCSTVCGTVCVITFLYKNALKPFLNDLVPQMNSQGIWLLFLWNVFHLHK